MNDQLVGIIVDFQLWKYMDKMRVAMWNRYMQSGSNRLAEFYCGQYNKVSDKQSSLVVYR